MWVKGLKDPMLKLYRIFNPGEVANEAQQRPKVCAGMVGSLKLKGVRLVSQVHLISSVWFNMMKHDQLKQYIVLFEV